MNIFGYEDFVAIFEGSPLINNWTIFVVIIGSFLRHVYIMGVFWGVS